MFPATVDRVFLSSSSPVVRPEIAARELFFKIQNGPDYKGALSWTGLDISGVKSKLLLSFGVMGALLVGLSLTAYDKLALMQRLER